MSIEATLTELLAGLVEGRLYPDFIPEENVAYPAISYQQAGGRAGWYVDRAKPQHKNARIQFNVWAKTRLEASTIARQVEDAICTSTLIAEPYGAPTALYEEMLALYGTRQDFGIWFAD